MKQRSSQFLVIVLGVIFVAALALCAGFYWLIGRTVARADKARDEISAGMERKIAAVRMRSALEQAAPDIAALKSRLVAADGAVSFIELVERTGREAGAFVSVKDVKYEEAGKGVQQLKLVVEADGSWRSVTEFLARASELPYKTAIDRMSVERLDPQTPKAKDAAPKGEWHASASVSVMMEK